MSICSKNQETQNGGLNMPLETYEVFNVLGDLMKDVGAMLNDEESPGKLTKQEILGLIQNLIVDAIAEATD